LLAAFIDQGSPEVMNPFLAGLLHPLTGTDHLIAMLAIGLWAAQLGNRARLWLPAGTLMLLLCGALLGLAQLQLPFSDAVIVASTVILLLLISFEIQTPVIAGALIVAVFALFHGYAHVIEMPADTRTAHYVAGLLLTSAGLTGIGVVFGSAIQRARMRII
jgi:urease accessory protein